MISPGSKRRVLFLSFLALFVFLSLNYYQVILYDAPQSGKIESQPPPDLQSNDDKGASQQVGNDSAKAEPVLTTLEPIIDLAALALPQEEEHSLYHIISSSTSPGGRYSPIYFGPGQFNRTLNPSVIPYPVLPETWIVLAQQHNSEPNPTTVQLACVVAYNGSTLQCLPNSPSIAVPILPTPGGGCDGDIAFLNLAQGPHDARLFYGPDSPLVIFGSNSGFTCFGLFIQDFRHLVQWPVDAHSEDVTVMEPNVDAPLANATEMQRPEPWGIMEKNWFVFWDRQGNMYAHFDIFPERGFARLHPDGSVEENLAPETAEGDAKCIGTYLPSGLSKLESIHQATNSLSVTLCRRADRRCKAEAENTFVFTIVQHKSYFDYHSEYDPYVVVFRQEAPFELYGISMKPLWIKGRQQFKNETTNMIYVASMNWKAKGLGYHGYLDDTVFIGFGIEDSESGAMEVLASDLLTGLGLCSDV